MYVKANHFIEYFPYNITEGTILETDEWCGPEENCFAFHPVGGFISINKNDFTTEGVCQACGNEGYIYDCMWVDSPPKCQKCNKEQ